MPGVPKFALFSIRGPSNEITIGYAWAVAVGETSNATNASIPKRFDIFGLPNIEVVETEPVKVRQHTGFFFQRQFTDAIKRAGSL